MIQTILLAIAGAILGLTPADIDLAPPIPLKHRSAWTHGPVIPAGALPLVRAYPGAWSFAAAFLATYALHLVMDMFPGKWRGSALINLYPIHYSLPPLLSFLYLLAGALTSLWVGSQVMGWTINIQDLTGLINLSGLF